MCIRDRSWEAWSRFGQTTPGWSRVQAICDFVHNHIAFDYQKARPTRTAWEAFNEGVGVCRDYAHLAIALCRCMNTPARYCTCLLYTSCGAGIKKAFPGRCNDEKTRGLEVDG